MLREGDVFYGCIAGLSGLSHPHYHIVVKEIPPDSVAIVYITSKIDNVKAECYRDDMALSTMIDPVSMVRINPGNLSVLTMDSVINCNRVSIKEVAYIESARDYRFERQIDNAGIIPKIIKAAKSSNTLVGKIKKQL